MSCAIVTGSGGLIGSATVRFLIDKGLDVVGIDNDFRQVFFGAQASTTWNVVTLSGMSGYTHCQQDIRDMDAMRKVFSRYARDISIVIHTAAQPSHDWACRDPQMDFTINANGTSNLLECTRQFCPDAVFIFTSTNKVYGDIVNSLPFVEEETRYELDPGHPYARYGVDESMSLDQCTHSLFGVSKAAADLLVQEYGRYYGMKTAVFRGGCLTGADHSAAELHGFLGYLARCAITNTPYTVFGYKGKQVRDNIHARDVANAFWHFSQAPRPGEVYNLGGGRHSNISVLEAIATFEKLSGRPMSVKVNPEHRIGDHQWWISDMRKFQRHYPDWHYSYGIQDILAEIYEGLAQRLGHK